MRIWPKIFVLILLFLAFAFPLQQHLNIPSIKPLSGAYYEEAKPNWTLTNWFTGDFQADFENYQKANFGYRPFLTRLHNQIHYSIYGEVFHEDIQEGKNGHLIGQEYLDAWQGLDIEEDSEIDRRAKSLKLLHNYLNEKHKSLLVVIAPDKLSTYPDHFGFEENSEHPKNNYNKWLKHLKNDTLPYIDFKAFYAQIAQEPSFPLFPKTGIHWSIHAMNNAMDSISAYLSVHSPFKPPRMVVEAVNKSTDYRPVEVDLENAINLLMPIAKESLGYQKYKMTEAEKPKILVIADSYFFEMYSSGLAAKYFDAPFFWYYNTRALKYDWLEAPRNPKHYEMDSLINETDVVLLMSTSSNLRDFPWAFDARIRKDLGLGQ